MQGNLDESQVKDSKIMALIILTLIASLLPDIIFIEWKGTTPSWLPFAKLISLFGAALFFIFTKKLKHLSMYPIILGTITIGNIITSYIFNTSFWQAAFHANSFVGNFGGSIILKGIGIIPVIIILIVLLKSPAEAYLCKGNLSIKAEEINWLGIKKDTISWRKLSLISAVCISLGTTLLTILTVTGTLGTVNFNRLVGYFPLVMLLALGNSFCEGVIFRSAILAPLKGLLTKSQAILIAAMFFGIAHYYGAPSGIVGVIMSGILGWYMCRSMYETKGFLSSWIIHFMQDVVIFSTILLLGNFI